MAEWFFPSYSLPDEISNDLLTVTINSVQISSVAILSSLMKTMHSQSQCIESLDKDARTRKVETEGRLVDLEKRFSREIDRLSGEFRDFVKQFKEVQSDLRHEINNLKLEITSLFERTLDKIYLDNAKRDSSIIPLHSRLDTLDAYVKKVWEFIQQTKEDMSDFGTCVETNRKAILANNDDMENLLHFLSLTRNAILQGNRNNDQIGMLLSTPLFRKLVSDCNTSSCIIDRKIDELIETLHSHAMYINKKVDVEVLEQTHDLLQQSILKGDQHLGITLEETKINLEECISDLALKLQVLGAPSNFNELKQNGEKIPFHPSNEELRGNAGALPSQFDKLERTMEDLFNRVINIEQYLSNANIDIDLKNKGYLSSHQEGAYIEPIKNEHRIHRIRHFTNSRVGEPNKPSMLSFERSSPSLQDTNFRSNNCSNPNFCSSSSSSSSVLRGHELMSKRSFTENSFNINRQDSPSVSYTPTNTVR